MILLIDKPLHVTSAKAVEQVKKALRVKKAGHAGTLDPLATGLLIIATDADTKQLTNFLKLSKAYEADILLGIRTTTGDLEGDVVEQTEVHVPHTEEIEHVLMNMVGPLELPVPIYSALKQGGKPLYKKARKGKAVEVPRRIMEVRSADFIDVTQTKRGPVIRVCFDVSSGTYIRSLGEELGRRLGMPATLSGLRRISIGQFDIKDAQELNSLDARDSKKRNT